MRRTSILFYYIPAILWSGIIFIACFLPGSDLPKNAFLDKIHFDKFVHATMYFIFFFLLMYALKRHWKDLTKTMILASAICITQGILIECVQGSSLVQGRSFELADIAANTSGAGIALLIYYQRHKTN